MVYSLVAMSIAMLTTRVPRLGTHLSSSLRRFGSSRSGDRSEKAPIVVLTKKYFDFLLSDLSNVKGVGPKTLEQLQNLGLVSVADVLFHFPTDILDRSHFVSLSSAKLGETITVKLTVRSSKKGFNSAPHVFGCHDSNNDFVEVKYFYGSNPYVADMRWFSLNKMYKPDSQIIVSGKLGMSNYSNSLEIVNPDLEMWAYESPQSIADTLVMPIYRLTQGLTNNKLRSIIQSCLRKVSLLSLDNAAAFAKQATSQQQQQQQLPSPTALSADDYLTRLDWLPSDFRTDRKWPTFLEALDCIHNPASGSLDSIKHSSPSRTRMAFNELTALFLHRSKKERTTATADVTTSPRDYSIIGNGIYTNQLVQLLPFDLTTCQKSALLEINRDMESEKRMKRLVQGDVGSGKTIVAILALLKAIECRTQQGALLAPTEILARQHYQTICKYFEEISVALSLDKALRVEFITGAVTGKNRDRLLADLNAGMIDVLVGTHALLTDSVANSFNQLGLVVIDEEQRFGVQQRDTLASKANVMFTTATPLPRSLMLLLDEEYKVSNLYSKPPLKRPVRTLVRPASATEKLIERVLVHAEHGSKVFWVSPTLQPDDKSPGTSVIERYEQLSKLFPNRIAMLHGQLSSDEKQSAMELFARKDSDVNILVSTSVVEVGVDVPESSICVVDGAENFGIAQLHQIRGRIGRGSPPPGERLEECFCVLLYNDRPSVTRIVDEESGRVLPPQKLLVLEKETDGFVIAEWDLSLRGPGDFFGFRQSGSYGYRATVLSEHAHLLPEAQQLARSIDDNISKHGHGYDEHIVGLMKLFPEPAPASTVAPAPPLILKSTTAVAFKPIASPQKEVLKRKSSGLTSAPSLEQLHNAVIILFDLETTGLSTKQDQVIQIGAKAYGESVENSFSIYVCPQIAVNPNAAEVNGLTNQFLADQGVPFPEAWSQFLAWLELASRPLPSSSSQRPLVLMAHNGQKFDFELLKYELLRHGICSEEDYKTYGRQMKIAGFVDSLQMFQQPNFWKDCSVTKPSNNKLMYLYEFFFSKKLEGAHNAIKDVCALEDILSLPGCRDIWFKYACKVMYVH